MLMPGILENVKLVIHLKLNFGQLLRQFVNLCVSLEFGPRFGYFGFHSWEKPLRSSAADMEGTGMWIPCDFSTSAVTK